MLADGFPQEFEWQQVSSCLRDSFQYSGAVVAQGVRLNFIAGRKIKDVTIHYYVMVFGFIFLFLPFCLEDRKYMTYHAVSDVSFQ